MSQLLAVSRRLAFGVAAIALTAGLSAGARAEQAYAFATQTISGLRGTPTALPGGAAVTLNLSEINFSTNDSAGLNGVNVVNEDPLDAPIAFVPAGASPGNNLPSPGIPNNFFAKYATFTNPATAQPAGALPTAGTISFGRGDVAITGTPNTLTSLGTVVAEAYVNGLAQKAFGQGQNQISTSFTLTSPGVTGTGTSTTVAIDYNYANDIFTSVASAGDKAQANYKFAVTITDLAGNIVFDFATPETNLNRNAPPNGPEIVRNGSQRILTPLLALNTTYNLSFSLQAGANVTSVVPEPATMAMALTALPLLGFGLMRRRNRKAQA